MSKVVDFQSRLQQRAAEQGEFYARMDIAAACIPVLVRAVVDMRELGADTKMIANTLRVAVEELDKSS